MVAVPGTKPVTCPTNAVSVLTVATLVLLLLHIRPLLIAVMLILVPAQNGVVPPVSATGSAITFKLVVVTQPVGRL